MIHQYDDEQEDKQGVDAQAAVWLIRLSEGHADTTIEREFHTWLELDPNHARAFEHASAVWHDLGHLSDTPVTGKREPSEASTLSATSRPSGIRQRYCAAAACILLFVITIYVYAPFQHLFAEYRTDVGEIRAFTLSDGSIMTLNSGSAASVDFNERERAVELLSGEALFEARPTAGQANRPFVVRFERGQALALGTRFSVRRLEAGTEVAVYEHAVEVSAKGDGYATPKRVILQERESVRLHDTVAPGPVTTVGSAQSLAWIDGQIVFDRAPLREAVSELNRHRPGLLVVLDSTLAERSVSGVFHLDKLDPAIDVIVTTLGARKLALGPLLTAIY